MKYVPQALLVALISVLMFSCTKQDIAPSINGVWECNTPWSIRLFSGSRETAHLVMDFDRHKAAFLTATDTVALGSLEYSLNRTTITVKMAFPDSTDTGRLLQWLQFNATENDLLPSQII